VLWLSALQCKFVRHWDSGGPNRVTAAEKARQVDHNIRKELT